MPMDLLTSMTQFGVAGLMGALWLWERAYSRKREGQLTLAHDRLMRDRESLGTLIHLVQQNTAAIERFDRTQTQLVQTLEELRHELRRNAA